MEKKTVPCPSTKAGGTQPCGFELFSCFNMCPICGGKVHQKWFQEGIKVQELNLQSESNKDELQHERSSIMTEDKNKDKDQNKGVENTDSEQEKEERKGVEEREGKVDNNEVTAETKKSEVVNEREEKSVREIQSEEEDKGGGTYNEMEKRQNNVGEDNIKEEETLEKGDLKYKQETIRKEASKESVSNNDNEEINGENDLKNDKSWINDDKKMKNVDIGTKEGKKEYSNIEQEEKEQSWENVSGEADMNDKKNTEEDQTGTKTAKEKGISEERLEGVEEREHTSLPLLKVSLQKSTFSNENEEKEDLEKDRKGEDIKDKTNNKEDKTGIIPPEKIGFSEERREGIIERESASLTLSKVPLQRSTLSDAKEEREDLEEDRKGKDINNKKNNGEGQTNKKTQGNIGISEERLEGNEERTCASLSLQRVQLQRSPLSYGKGKKEEREGNRRGEDVKGIENTEEGQKDTKKTGKMGISEERLEGSEERESASLTWLNAPLQRSRLSGDFERANPEFSVQEDIHQDIVQCENTSDKTDKKSGNSENNSKKQTTNVGFHAFISQNVDFNHPKKDELYVVLDLRGEFWKVKMKISELKSKTDDEGGIRMYAFIEIEKDKLKRPDLTYKYYIKRRGSRLYEEEYFYQQFNQYQNKGRTLNVPADIDVYIQYDGYIYAKKGGRIKALKEYFGMQKSTVSIIRNDGEHALKVYLPDICGVMKTPNQVPSKMITTVEKFCQVCKGGVVDHFIRDKHHYDPKIWQQFVWEYQLENAIKALENNKNEMDQHETLFQALLIVNILGELNIPTDILSSKAVDIIHYSLLLAIDANSSQCPQLDYLNKILEPSLKNSIRCSLISFLKDSARKTKQTTERNPLWMVCLPIVHFLDATLNPFQELDCANFQDENSAWWIISELEVEKNGLKNCIWSRTPLEVMNLMKPLFKLDTKTQRSFMACLKIEDLEVALKEKNILLEIKLATLAYYFKTCESKDKMVKLENCLPTVFELCKEQLDTLSNPKKSDWMEVDERFKIQVVKCIMITAIGIKKLPKMTYKRSLLCLFHCDMLLLAVLETLSKESDELKNFEEISKCFIDPILENAEKGGIPEFDCALSMMRFVSKNDLSDEWERKCLMYAKNKFEAMDKRYRLDVFIHSMDRLQNESLKNMMQEALKESISDILQDPSYFRSVYERLWPTNNIAILSTMFSKIWKMDPNLEWSNSNHDLMYQALSFPIYPECVEAFFSRKIIINEMDKKARFYLENSVSLMESSFKNLKTNSIQMKMLKLFVSKKDAFIAVANVFEKHSSQRLPLTTRELKNILRCREKDLNRLKEIITTVQKAKYFLNEISENSNITIMDEEKSLTQNWHQLEIGKIFKIPEESLESDQYHPDFILYGELLSNLTYIENNMSCYDESKSFHDILKRKAQSFKTPTVLNFNDVIKEVLIPVKETMDDLCKQIQNGSISVREIEKFSLREFSEAELCAELIAMNRGSKDEWINERIAQLQRFRMFSKTVLIAKLLLNIKNEYEIDGSFENLELIANSTTEKDVLLKDLKIDIQIFNEKLERIDEIQKKSVTSFLKSSELVKWMKNTLPGGIKDLKIYADLALLSVEGDEHVGRVTKLHSAAIGYSSVIFGNIDGEDQMIDSWEEVWQNLKRDNFLPQNLEESNRVLNWFIEIKESHGSVEVTSLKQVDAIKDRGIFKIGNSGKVAAGKHQLDLDDVIWLHVPAAKCAKDETEDIDDKDPKNQIKTKENDESLISLQREREKLEGEGRDYSLDEMADLQSRLMLVTGKADAGRESIERFTSIFDNVTRLGKVFNQLHASGCILFKRWTFEFHCNPNAERNVIIRTHDLSVVKGTNYPQRNEESECAQSNVNEYIKEIADFMENCYEEWVNYIKDKRSIFYPLNFYTVDQMVLLQEEIAKYRNGSEDLRFLCPLLSLVAPHCSLDTDLDYAVDKVQENLLTSEQMSTLENSSERKNQAEAIQKFLKITKESGISRKHALRAIQSQEFDIENIEAGLLWCLSNDEKDEPIIENAPETVDLNRDTKIGDKLKHFGEELEETMRMHGLASLIHNLEGTWKKFLNCASSSVTDFLSIDHLGMILDVLYKRGNCTMKRTLIYPLKCGIPNLIVCPQSEVVPMVLTIYMYDDTLPLPTRNEVLLCTEHTTKEEVDIFFRRALFQIKSHTCQQIYCLMNADKLKYDASEQSLKDVTEYIKSASEGYRLVIICSSENEYKSPMISALDKYRAPKIPVALNEKIKEYLKRKYTPQNIPESAAAVDSSGSCLRVVKSERAGVGKSLYKTRLTERLIEKHKTTAGAEYSLSITIPLSQKKIEMSEVSNRILKSTLPTDASYSRIFHIDISYGIEQYVGTWLFNLLILGSLVDENGYVFHRSESDLYIIETTIPNNTEQDAFLSAIQLLNILPNVKCISPQEDLEDNLETDTDVKAVGFDEKRFQSDEFQRPYHYLLYYESKQGDIPIFNTENKEKNKKQCLQVLLRHCCVDNPSWAELRNFVTFLNTQLKDFEKSIYCNAILKQDLPGFPVFVLRFLVQMSKDFSTRSLEISNRKANTNTDKETEDKVSNSVGKVTTSSDATDEINQFQMRRKWETSVHPYLFFNPDQQTMTFIGFNIDKDSRSLVDQETRVTLEENIMSKELYGALKRNGVPLQDDFDGLTRNKKIERLCRVVGNNRPQDPDNTYELTSDNVKKMMAIYMRFRCGIPVIVMGETGCGKTCLIKFLCSLQCPAGCEINAMTLMKVHGGTTKKDIIEKVRQAEDLAKHNCQEHGKHIITVLFFDEANTTEAVGCIKEIMCDGTIDGHPLALNTNLKLVAACNPYRKHSEEMIKRLERAGLGYHVNPDETDDKLGRIPMRHLVYRVQPLPQSMLPLVWDFGQLDSNVEKLYIKQMIKRCVRNKTLPAVSSEAISILNSILAASQEYMRKQEDECSFVSLRDVERTLNVCGWIYHKSEIFDAIKQLEFGEQKDDEKKTTLSSTGCDNAKMTQALLLALGVCYHSSLSSREEYRAYISKYFDKPLGLSEGGDEMERTITRCQMAFLHNLKLNNNIAKNVALRENFFMMAVCVELRIPLFLVGKPGSSKSLSKTILDHNMQGRDSESPLFKSLKQVQLISFQCSPLATADGILKTFKQASTFQKSKDLEKFVSVVVLDEIGLAEDSPRMPLKALHSLLEDGCHDDEKVEEYKKVSFIGISNWALDPAKMNRGILVQRDVPDEQDLKESARGICEQDDVYRYFQDLIPNLAKAYLHVFQKACNSNTLLEHFDEVTSENQLKREFFGLRDFYSLIKMICEVVVKNRRRPTEQELSIAIKRNFGGLVGLNPVQEFGKYLPDLQELAQQQGKYTDTVLLKECLHYEEKKRESRYILLLTENYGALNLLHQLMGNGENTHVIFGSSFPRDQEYIEICRNINRIKVFMETGKTVVLLNLENLYESLYDALNQYYMESGPDRYVDLGLGTHRVKCKVDKKFRLVVVAEKRVVYREFPIPLINRMEKHFLTMEGMLTTVQLNLSSKLEKWANKFSSRNIRKEEVFIGYNKDTSAGVILKASDLVNSLSDDDSSQQKVLETAKSILLWGSTPDAVLRLNKTELGSVAKIYQKSYFEDQCHDSLYDFLQYRIKHKNFGGNFIQITTHSKLMSEADRQDIEKRLPFFSGKVCLLSLQAFDTEQQFSYQIREISQKGKKLLLVQCNTGDENCSLIECARHCVQRELQNNESDLCVIFLVHLSRVSKSVFSGFQTGVWTSVHIDELRLTSFPSIQDLMTKSISNILQESRISDVAECISDSGTYNHERHVNLRTILFNCVHPALASIVELHDDDQGRSIKRVKFIFKELSMNCNWTEGQFGYGLMKHVLKAVPKQKVDESFYDESWIQNVAAKSSSVNKTGTLRASCQKIIEEKVTPILAEIVAFVDTNSNTMILESSEKTWITGLWLGIFNIIDVEDIEKNTSGEHFSANFPFSWIIYGAVEKIFHVTSENAIGKSAEELFENSKIGRYIRLHLARENFIEATKLYILDFVKMSHKTSSSKEEMIVCEFLRVWLEENMAGRDDIFTNRLFCLHNTFRDTYSNLEILSEVMCFIHKDNDSFYKTIIKDIKTMDIAAVKYILDDMERVEEIIDTLDGQNQWVEHVQKYRSVVERLLHINLEKTQPRAKLIDNIRSQWTKTVVLKLFIENLCIDTTREKLMAQSSKILWRLIGRNCNLKDKSSLDKLEKFLIASNSKALTDFLGKVAKCQNCETNFGSSSPVLLPCGHRICRQACFSFLKNLPEDQKMCPVAKCSKNIQENFDEKETPEQEKIQMRLFKDYQERCNRFYMQVVSQLCFANSTPPSEDVMQHLLELIIHKKTIPKLNLTIIRTSELSVLETVVDTTPVFRSFLLQLMIRTSEEAVFQHLENFLQETEPKSNHELELCLMLIQCIEDSLTEQSNTVTSERGKEIAFLKTMFSYGIKNLQSTSVMVKLRSVATVRYCLQSTAKYLRECYSSNSETNSCEYDDVFKMAADLCNLPINHIRIFLVSHICRTYGLDLYQSLLQSNENWIFPVERREKQITQECPDYCIVLGDTYREIRDNVAGLLEANEHISLTITKKSDSVQLFYILALIKEMRIRPSVSKTSFQFAEALKGNFESHNFQTVLNFLEDALNDSFGKSCKQLQIQYHRDIKGQGIVILLLHFLIGVKTLTSNKIMKPLILLATNPILLKDSFLPTMPGEVSNEIRNELQRMEEEANKIHHNVKWYRCPNGHPYAVGDCGSPTQGGKCYECKADIGTLSSNRKLVNTKDNGDDFSQPGHILGSADGRSTQAISERTLSPSSNILLRLLTHIAMLIGANENLNDVCQLISPKISSDTVPDFLWAHLNKDIETLQASFDRSLDDVIMFLHTTVQSLFEEDSKFAENSDVSLWDLSTRKGRATWEAEIDKTFLSRLLQRRQDFFERNRDIFANDRIIESDPLLRLALRRATYSTNEFSTFSLQASPFVWQHRTKVTFEHFVQEFHVMKSKEFINKNQFFVLENFLHQECQLRHLRHLPNILQMQKILVSKFGKKITREEAATITLQDFVNQLSNDPAKTKVVQGVSSFCELWNSLRHQLISFYDKSEMKSLFEKDISAETSNIRAVFPDTQGVGLCSRVIFEYLIGKQNNFVTLCGQKIDPRFSTDRKVSLRDLTAIHLINFKREADIFPIILSNCNYTYMQEEDIKLEYDFDNIQAVLQDRYLFGKAIVDISTGFPAMAYKGDTTVSGKFDTLMNKIKQEALNRAIQSQIAVEFTDIPELYETISNIDVVVNFLLSIRVSEDTLLNSFIVDTLEMASLPSSKACQCCKLSHVQSLWFLLTHEKTKRLHYSEKDAFDSMNSSIQDSLPEECIVELDTYLNDLSLEKLEILLEQLMECIIFSLNCGEGDRDSYQYSLIEYLIVHLESPVYPEVDLKSLSTDDVNGIPAPIMAVHAVEMWKKIYNAIRSRK